MRRVGVSGSHEGPGGQLRAGPERFGAGKATQRGVQIATLVGGCSQLEVVLGSGKLGSLTGPDWQLQAMHLLGSTGPLQGASWVLQHGPSVGMHEGAQDAKQLADMAGLRGGDLQPIRGGGALGGGSRAIVGRPQRASGAPPTREAQRGHALKGVWCVH